MTRRIALVEAVSYLVLMVAVIVKYTADDPTGVEVLGPIHGVIVLVYAAALWRLRGSGAWDTQRVVTAVVLAAVPLGGFWVERNWRSGDDQEG